VVGGVPDVLIVKHPLTRPSFSAPTPQKKWWAAYQTFARARGIAADSPNISVVSPCGQVRCRKRALRRRQNALFKAKRALVKSPASTSPFTASPQVPQKSPAKVQNSPVTVPCEPHTSLTNEPYKSAPQEPYKRALPTLAGGERAALQSPTKQSYVSRALLKSPTKQSCAKFPTKEPYQTILCVKSHTKEPYQLAAQVAGALHALSRRARAGGYRAGGGKQGAWPVRRDAGVCM